MAAKWPNHALNGIFSYLPSTVLNVWISNFHLSLLDFFLKICKFGSFVYIFDMATKMAKSMLRTVHVCSPQFLLYVSQVYIYIYAWLRSSIKICKVGSFAYSIWPPRWSNYVRNSSFSCLQSIISMAIISFCDGYLLDELHSKHNTALVYRIVCTFYKLHVSIIPNCWYASCLVIFYPLLIQIPCKLCVGQQQLMLHVYMRPQYII